MDYENRYKEALEKAKKIYKTAQDYLCKDSKIGVECLKNALTDVFPELAESEDERIRKWLICGMNALKEYKTETFATIPIDDAIAWLEKQGEKKPFDYENANVQQKDFAPTEPRFHESEWIVDSQGLTHQIERVVENVTTHTFGYDIVGGGYFNDDSEVRLWSIEMLKDGDVLVSTWKGHSYIYIFKEIKNNAIESHICYYPELDTISDGIVTMANTPTVPATKEQRNTLFAKIKEEGYEWDAEKKELLKKIESNPDDLIEESYQQQADDLIDTVTEESAWNKNDDIHLRDAIYAAENIYTDKCGKEELVDWLKSLKNRLQPQPKQERSEEDMSKVQRICKYLNEAKKYYADTTEVRECIEWLKERLNGEQ